MLSEKVKNDKRIVYIKNFKIKLQPVSLAAAAGCAVLMISPSLSVAAAQKGIELWFMTVVPSMLPFFVFTDMLVKSGVHLKAGSVLEKPVRFLMGTPGTAAFAFVTSVISGYPAGARVIGELRRKGEISDVEAADMLSFCSTSGPLFIVGAVGAGMLDSSGAGYIILISHYLSALLTGVFFARSSVMNRRRSDIVTVRHSKNSETRVIYNRSLTDVMAESITSSFSTLFVIGGFIVIFSILTEYICHFMPMLIDKISTAGILNRLPEYNGDTFISFIVTVSAGLLEMTVGCSRIACLKNVSVELITVICSFFVSFGGLSVAMQTMSVLAGTKIRMKDYLKIKIFQGAVSAVITMGLVGMMC